MGEQSNEKPGAAGKRKDAQRTVASKAKKSMDDPRSPDDDAAVKLDASAQALIGQQLRAVYGEIVNQPVPDHLLKLLEDLERKSEGQ